MSAAEMQRGDSSHSHFSSGSTVYDDEAAIDRIWRDDRRIWIPAGPSEDSRRTLVLCFDGTGDEFDSDNSNVVQLCSMLRKDDTTKQLVYYQAGIGTYAESSFTPFAYISSTLDEMFATKLGVHIQEGYEFLMQNYTRGDKICIFGFSRGAYTARALAGMLQKVGLLPLHNFQQVPFAYNMYKRDDPEGLELSELFKRTFCRQVHVDFLGVWDTVASVGAIPRYLPFVNENNSIRHLRHALALDERRIKFLPSYCVEPKKKARNGLQGDTDSPPPLRRISSDAKRYEDAINSQERATDVKEVWFAGVHCDVGGGSVKNNTPHALARIPLRWMIRECFRCDTGITFDAVMLQQIGLNVKRDKSGKVVLLDVPDRIPSSPPEDAPIQEKTTFAEFLGALAHLAWGIISAPFKRLFSIFRTSLHAATHAKHRRQVVPARRQEVIEYKLKDDIDENYEAAEEQKDALSPLYDQLTQNWLWVVMEYLPMRIKKQKAIVRDIENSEGFKWIVNRGRGRKIFKHEMKEGMRVHRSVKTRLEAGPIFFNGHYIPRVRPSIGPGKKREPRTLDHHEWNVDDPAYWEWVD
ncbi:hypothetical protein BDY19DRAFT_1086277 [Irpex rosettiformis]|uniref:Uncharacterized protein n=1 Tax=Irpex rosettiformis TaxID=378272 RepID=A0ACB8UA81_9APHY|nr:hypothetical protein BDY19DRAFT_1086277 [Irpex rosettiformis]